MTVIGTGEPFRGYATAMTAPRYHADSKWSKCDTSPRHLTSVSPACPRTRGDDPRRPARAGGGLHECRLHAASAPHLAALQRGRLSTSPATTSNQAHGTHEGVFADAGRFTVLHEGLRQRVF